MRLGPGLARSNGATLPLQQRVARYGEDVVLALRFCWAVLEAPTGKRLALVMGELVATLSA